jgi:hypothetical protein
MLLQFPAATCQSHDRDGPVSPDWRTMFVVPPEHNSSEGAEGLVTFGFGATVTVRVLVSPLQMPADGVI